MLELFTKLLLTQYMSDAVLELWIIDFFFHRQIFSNLAVFDFSNFELSPDGPTVRSITKPKFEFDNLTNFFWPGFFFFILIKSKNLFLYYFTENIKYHIIFDVFCEIKNTYFASK